MPYSTIRFRRIGVFCIAELCVFEIVKIKTEPFQIRYVSIEYHTVGWRIFSHLTGYNIKDCEKFTHRTVSPSTM
jgi:hypothetical protein